jgi:hypothetical protein
VLDLRSRQKRIFFKKLVGIGSISFGGHQGALQDNMIRDGLLAIKDYGKIMLKSSLWVPTLSDTNAAEKKIKALLKQ